MNAYMPTTEILSGLEHYKRTPEFTVENVPKALLSTHITKVGVWGLIRVLSGRLRYHIDAEPFATIDVPAGGATLIKPETPHHVELLERSTVFVVEFYRPGLAE
jgi:hemoglobin